jgi:hypothetical protein
MVRCKGQEMLHSCILCSCKAEYVYVYSIPACLAEPVSSLISPSNFQAAFSHAGASTPSEYYTTRDLR